MAKKVKAEVKDFVVVLHKADQLVSYCHVFEIGEDERVEFISYHDSEEEAKQAQRDYAELNELKYQY